ncbi:MAG TPA: DNA cytosine methyltransferase [Ktedonobacteraceae bacterium]|nr:DNA cytosine methyltransferase [Ktedonobacteraceae bacterium]
MRKPRLLDLFCGAGGCAKGYADAGFEVIGVDNRPQKNYPYEFHLADALEFLDTADLSSFSAIHASPPCPRYTSITALSGNRNKHPDLVAIVRKKLQMTGKPYVIENVTGAPFEQGVMLCGSMFDLRIRRHRCFESNLLIMAPGPCRHHGEIMSIHGAHTRDYSGKVLVINENWQQSRKWRPINVPKERGMEAMGITWAMTQDELSNAIPPAYTKWIGRQLLEYLRMDREAVAV